MGFLFLVLYPPSSAASRLHAHAHSLTHTHTLTHPLTHSLCALPRGRIYAPGFRWRPWVSASFAWQAWDNVECQGVGCTPRGLLASLGLRLFCVAGAGQCALSRGRMYAPGFRWRPWVSASFAWQARDNVHCQGVGCTPRGSAGVPGSPPLLRGRRGTMCTAKGSHVRPGFRWRPWVSTSFAWQAWDNVHCQGVGCTPPGFRWRPWVSASFAWQAWDNVHCQGVGCTPRGSAGVPGSPHTPKLFLYKMHMLYVYKMLFRDSFYRGFAWPSIKCSPELPIFLFYRELPSQHQK